MSDPAVLQLLERPPTDEHVETLAAILCGALAPGIITALQSNVQLEELARTSVGMARAIVAINRLTDDEA